MTTTQDKLTPGTVIRFRPSLLANARLTVRLDRDASVDTLDNGRTYAVLLGYRVRPADLSVSFGLRKVYCINVDDIEIVREG